MKPVSASWGTWRRHLVAWALVPAMAWSPAWVAAQPAGLPSLGDSASAALSPRVEARLGEALLAEGRHDPSYIDDPAVSQYLTEMGYRLAEHASGTPPRLTLFSIRDPSINAFAMPGGLIGVHSGLVVATQNESELAGVVAHELAHVQQRHVARGLAQQGQSDAMMLGLMLGALAAAAAGASQLAMGAAAFGQAAVINSQLSFSREAEREADRVGVQMMSGAGYDPAGMVSMFDRMSRDARFNQGGGPGYAGTHPLSLDRMSDMQNRVRGLAAPGSRASDTYWFIRARLQVMQGDSNRAIDVSDSLRHQGQSSSGAPAAAGWYGLALRQLQLGRLEAAGEALERARATGVEHPLLTQLQVEWLEKNDRQAEAVQLANDASQRWPDDRLLALSRARLLLRQGEIETAASWLARSLERWPEAEPELYRLMAEAQAAQGRAVDEARYLSEYYQRVGAWPSALQQMQRARAASRDFHEQSVFDARIREIQRRIEEDRALLAEFR